MRHRMQCRPICTSLRGNNRCTESLDATRGAHYKAVGCCRCMSSIIVHHSRAKVPPSSSSPFLWQVHNPRLESVSLMTCAREKGLLALTFIIVSCSTCHQTNPVQMYLMSFILRALKAERLKDISHFDMLSWSILETKATTDGVQGRESEWDTQMEIQPVILRPLDFTVK